jgi:hypothetical protein
MMAEFQQAETLIYLPFRKSLELVGISLLA